MVWDITKQEAVDSHLSGTYPGVEALGHTVGDTQLWQILSVCPALQQWAGCRGSVH